MMKEVRNRFTLSGGLNDTDQQQIAALLDWIDEAERFLAKLWDLISKTLVTWERFNASGGDQCYFRDLSDRRTRRMLNVIKKSFERLADLKSQLNDLIKLVEAYRCKVRPTLVKCNAITNYILS